MTLLVLRGFLLFAPIAVEVEVEVATGDATGDSLRLMMDRLVYGKDGRTG